MQPAGRIRISAIDEGCLTELPLPGKSVGAFVYWYSIITTPPSELEPVWHELHRGARKRCVAALQRLQKLTWYRHSADDVSESLRACGFEIRAEVRRQPELAHETTPQAFILLARSVTQNL